MLNRFVTEYWISGPRTGRVWGQSLMLGMGSAGDTVLAASFGACIELGNGNCSFHWECWVKPVYMCAHVCEEQLGSAEEGRWCAR